MKNVYLRVWDNFHLKCISFHEPFNCIQVHPPEWYFVSIQLMDVYKIWGNMTYKLFVLKILNFSMDLNSLTCFKESTPYHQTINWANLYCKQECACIIQRKDTGTTPNFQ